MARKHLISIALLGLMAGGCVSQEKYNAVKLDRDRYAEQLQRIHRGEGIAGGDD